MTEEQQPTAAERLYPHLQSEARKEPAPQTVLGGGSVENRDDDKPAADPDASKAERLYGDTEAERFRNVNLDPLAPFTTEGTEWNDAADQYREGFAAMGADPGQAAEGTQILAQYLANPVVGPAAEALADRTERELRGRWGDHEYEQRLENAKALVASIDGAAELLDATGAGNDPKIVNTLLTLASQGRGRERAAAFLKRLAKGAR